MSSTSQILEDVEDPEDIEDVEQWLEKITDEAGKGQLKLHSVQGYGFIFEYLLQRFNRGPGDAEDV